MTEYQEALVKVIDGMDDTSAIKKLDEIEFMIQMKDHWSISDTQRVDACTWLKKQIKEGKRDDIR